MKKKTVILGAGFTGLAAAIKTGGTILEATGKPGGICRSYNKKGYHFDNLGGHWIFKADDVLEFIKKYSAVKPYTRRAGVYFNHTFPYPFQDILTQPRSCFKGSLKGWMDSKFGPALCNTFFDPWHEKYTGGLYDQIIQDDAQKSPKPKDVGYNKYYYYPTNGLSELVDNMAKECDVKYHKKVNKIDTKNKKVYCVDGSYARYDRLISTIPLCDLLDLLNIEYKLPYTTCQVLNIGAERGKNCPDEHWLYIPYCRSGFYRVGFYSNVDKRFAPDGKVSIYVEKSKQLGILPHLYKENVIRELQEWGWIGDVDCADLNEVRVAYTWLFPDSQREILLLKAKALGVESIGRYGKWKFQGIAESIQDGLNS